MPTTPTRRRIRTAFTLIELLVVIGIIIILLGILLPVFSKVRMASYNASTQAEISTISNAITRYYADFNAYPGPLSNDQVELPTGMLPVTIGLYNSTTNSTTPTTGNISMSQNLTLGLLGGLTTLNLTSTTATFDPTTVGQGPLCLNPLNPHRYSDYINDFSGLLSNGRFVDAGGNYGADNSAIPVFVDRFPNNPLPILYLRARVGAPGVMAVGQNALVNGTATRVQYDLNQIIAYTSNALTHIGKPLGSPTYIVDQSGNNYHGLNALGPYSGQLIQEAKSTTTPGADAGTYFWNQNATVGSTGPETSGRPRSVDQFILISAGKDGTYGTPDDLTSFGDVMQ